MDNRPIGIFDSGIGGLTAFKKVRQLMPNEDIIYFGDTSRVPYGGRSSDTIKQYAAQDIRFLLSHQVKMIVIACGTVSANLPPILQQLSVPYTGVLQPAVEAACRATKTRRIGILATAATIRSCAYEKAIFEILPDAMLVPKACPMFVPLVENGYIQKDCTVTRMIAEEYLAPLKEAEVDTIILGCTHYPVIKELIGDLVGPDVTLIDSGKEAARYTQRYLEQNGLRTHRTQPGASHFFVSDTVDSFAATARIFLGKDVGRDASHIDINQY